VKVWSRHSIFRKEHTVSRLLLGCIDLWVSCEWDDPESTDIMESHRRSYSVGESQMRYTSLPEVESSVYVLWASRSLTWERWIMNYDRHLMVLWKCMRNDGFMLIFKVTFILKVLKIASSPH